METSENNLESKENIEYVDFNKVMRKLGQTQYTSIFVNPSPKLHEDGEPYFEDIRIEGNPDDYYSIKIHPDDVRKFIEKWLEYKKSVNMMVFGNKKVEDYL